MKIMGKVKTNAGWGIGGVTGVTELGMEANKLPKKMGMTTKKVRIIGVKKIMIPLTILPTYICPVPGRISERSTAMTSSFLE